MAAGVPLLLGFTAVIGALGLIKPISHLYPVAQGQIEPVVLLVGLAVGVDYSMFYLRRKLEERHAGCDNSTALARAAATSGRAVLTSGLTVMTAMAGMLLAGNAVFISLGIGTMLVVAVAVIGSVTVLPAVMAASRRPRRVGASALHRPAAGRGPVPDVDRARRSGAAPAAAVARSCRPACCSLLAAPGAAACAPSTPVSVGLPRSLPIMQTYDRIEAAFPGAPMSALVVVTAKDVTAPDVSGRSGRPQPSGPRPKRTNGRPRGGDGQLRPDRCHRHRRPRRQRNRSHIDRSSCGPAYAGHPRHDRPRRRVPVRM